MAKKGTVRDMLRMLRKDGWEMVGQRGSHRQFKHPQKPGRVTVSGAESDDVYPGKWDSMMRQAGMK